MKIKLKNDHSQSCPGDHVVFKAKAGDVLHMSFATTKYPGKPIVKGSFGWLEGREKQNTENPVHQEWVFWSSCDIDFALIYHPKDISTLYLTQQEREQIPNTAFSGIPFEVEICQ